MCCLSCVVYHVLSITCCLSCVVYHVLSIMCCLSCVQTSSVDTCPRNYSTSDMFCILTKCRTSLSFMCMTGFETGFMLFTFWLFILWFAWPCPCPWPCPWPCCVHSLCHSVLRLSVLSFSLLNLLLHAIFVMPYPMLVSHLNVPAVFVSFYRPRDPTSVHAALCLHTMTRSHIHELVYVARHMVLFTLGLQKL